MMEKPPASKLESGYSPGQSDMRPWGTWRVIEASNSFTVKTIEVGVGQRLSLQHHHHRSEHWVIVEGNGVVKIGGDNIKVERGSHIYVPRETNHRITNNGVDKLVFVEVQYGDRLDEDDIVRLDDDYKRT